MRRPAPNALRLLRAALVLALLLSGGEALAYVGPGAGFAFVSSFFLLLGTLLVTFFVLLTWPLRALWRLLRRKRRAHPAALDGLVVVGLDGLDPDVLRELMQAGRLPSFSRIAERGGFGPLATTFPAISPVAWSSFATGVDPSRHGIFDFLTRDPRDYSTVLSSTEIRPPRRALRLGPLRLPLGRASLRLLRRGIPFWRTLGEHGVPVTVLRVPITFPAERFQGTLLSGMCAPDLLGTQGSFLYFTSEPGGDDPAGGLTFRVKVEQDRVRARLRGPAHPLRRDGRPLELPLEARLDRERQRATLRVGGERVTLEPGRHSDWVEVRFRLGPLMKLRGLCRFRLISLDPFRLYATPLNIDPARPAMPVSHPAFFSVFLAKLIGRFSTLGLAEDTGALNAGVLDRDGFLEQAQLFHEERERMLFQMVRRHRRGVCVCVFDITDRVQHMFMAQRGREGDAHAGAIDALYEQMDRMLGRLLAEVEGPRSAVMVVSDHGFAPFERGVNLNTWLLEQGYLALEPGRELPGEYLEGVDWSRTRAFAVGLAGLYLNQRGREARGVVAPEEAPALRREIRDGLLALRDPGGEAAPVREVFDTHELYDGPFRDHAPDLLVGYQRGYRASWETAKGSGARPVVAPNTREWTGDHCMDPRLVPGVLVSSHALRLEGARLVDMAPTILDLFGIRPPANMTGRSLALREEGAS